MKKTILSLILLIFVIGCAKQIETLIEEPKQQHPTIQEKETVQEIPEEDENWL